MKNVIEGRWTRGIISYNTVASVVRTTVRLFSFSVIMIGYMPCPNDETHESAFMRMSCVIRAESASTPDHCR